jgi:LysM repeat protein/ABC-type branched-subunit amino acid transport system substrate-binding protein
MVSQVPVEPAKEKVIISGVPYYIHQVRKGQTVYSISRAYGISVQDLTAENPPALNGIKEGQTLRIPVSSATGKIADPSPRIIEQKDESRFTYHKMRPGETIYALSKLYGVPENLLIDSNRGIDINKLTVGSEIAVPKRDLTTQKQKVNDQQKKYIYHKVEKDETLFSIASKYGISIKEIRRENKNIRFPQVGDYLKIPVSGESVAEPEETTPVDTVPDIKEAEVPRIERQEGLSQLGRLEGSFDIAVLLPFYLDVNSSRTQTDSSVVKGKKQYRVSEMPGDWIYPESLDFVEMYNGILLAADTLRARGLNLNIHTFDIRRDTIEISRLIRSGQLSGMDLIIGPAYSGNLQIVSKWAGSRGIPVISPVPLINNSVLSGNSTVFMASPSLEVARRAMSKQIAESNKSNLIFIHTNSIDEADDVSSLKKSIFDELTKKMDYKDINFSELVFIPRTLGSDSINRIAHAMSDTRENVVIIASEEPPVLSEILTVVHGLSKKYNVKVYGYPSMIYLDNLDPKLFFELNQVVFSPYKIDYSSENVKRFNLNYFSKFRTMPLESSFAWIGYDIFYYFISGLSIHGQEFINNPAMHNPGLLQNEFDFERKNANDGFENQKLFRIRYTRDYEIVSED